MSKQRGKGLEVEGSYRRDKEERSRVEECIKEIQTKGAHTLFYFSRDNKSTPTVENIAVDIITTSVMFRYKSA